MTNVVAVVIHTDGFRTDLKEINLPAMQDAVGGYVECIALTNMVNVWVNDDWTGLRSNNGASLIFQRALYGDVVVTGGVDKEGNTLPLNEVFVKRLAKLFAKRKTKKGGK